MDFFVFEEGGGACQISAHGLWVNKQMAPAWRGPAFQPSGVKDSSPSPHRWSHLLSHCPQKLVNSFNLHLHVREIWVWVFSLVLTVGLYSTSLKSLKILFPGLLAKENTAHEEQEIPSQNASCLLSFHPVTLFFYPFHHCLSSIVFSPTQFSPSASGHPLYYTIASFRAFPT